MLLNPAWLKRTVFKRKLIKCVRELPRAQDAAGAAQEGGHSKTQKMQILITGETTEMRLNNLIHNLRMKESENKEIQLNISNCETSITIDDNL